MKISTAALCTLAALTAQEVVRNVTIASAHDGTQPQASTATPAVKSKQAAVTATPVAIAQPEVLPVTKSTLAMRPTASQPPVQATNASRATPVFQVQAYHPAAGPRLVVRRRFRNLASPQVIAQAPRPSVPIAQGASTTPISDRFGVRGTEPNAEAWRSAVKQRYGIPTIPTPITDRFGARGTEPNAEAWRAAIKQRYGIRSIPTPITDRFGATGTEPNADAWRSAIKQRYGIRIR